VGFVEGDVNDAHVFFMRERGTLPGRAAGHQKIYAVLNLAADQSAESFFIERTIGPKIVASIRLLLKIFARYF
jgi:hypothetical protein